MTLYSKIEKLSYVLPVKPTCVHHLTVHDSKDNTELFTLAQMQEYAAETVKLFQANMLETMRNSSISNMFIPAELHSSTVDLVTETASDLAAKLYKAQIKLKLDHGWDMLPSDTTAGDGRFFLTESDCNKALINHLQKGDVIDSIAYLAFMNSKGWNLAEF